MKRIGLYLLVILIVFLSNCKMETKTDINKAEYLSLSDINSVGNYEIIKLVAEQNSAKYIQFDKNDKTIVLYSYFISENKNMNTCETLKINVNGEKTIINDAADDILMDGTMWNWTYYRNWLIDQDSTKHQYLDPLTEEEKRKPKKWLVKFEELYKKASFIHEDVGVYYFKVDNVWYLIETNEMAKSLDILMSKQYPPKEGEIRMIELKDLCPSFSLPPEKRDSSLLVERKYVSEQFQKSERGSGFNFSAGWWYLDLHMPGGDTIKIKRYASFKNPELEIYRIPEEYGGRKDVLFIIQKTDDMLKQQVGGMYVIRPKNLK